MDLLLRSAYNLIHKHGILSNYNIVTKGSYDNGTQKASISYATVQIKCYSRTSRLSNIQTPNLILNANNKLFISGIDAELVSLSPKVGDTVQYDGSTLKVQSVDKSYAHGTVGLWILSVSK